MSGHGIEQSAKNVSKYVKSQIGDAAHRFDAEPELKKLIRNQNKMDALKDIATFKRVQIANKHIKDALTSEEVSDWRRRTRNNELAKSIAAYAAPLAVAGTGLAAYQKIRKRKEEKNMEKMSAEQYTEFVQKLAEEIVDDVVSEDGAEVLASEGFDADQVDDIANRAIMAYESAQMRKQAAEADYTEACAYEDAAMLILDECEG